MKAWGDESMWEAFRSNISCSWVFSGCFRWVLTPTLWRWEPMTERERGGEREREQARQGWLSYITSAAVAWHRLVMLRITTPQSTTKRCVCGVCKRQREMVLRGWSAGLPMGELVGLLLIVQLSLLIMPPSNQCKRQQEPKWHFSILITHVSFVVQLSFAFTLLQSFTSDVLRSRSIWFHSFGVAQWHLWDELRGC